MNEKGSTLILVLIISTVFMILGLSILAVALNGSTRTQLRTETIGELYEGKEEIELLTASFKEEVEYASSNLLSISLPSEYNSAYIPELNKLISNTIETFPALKSKGLTINDITDEYIDEVTDLDKTYTRVFEISIPLDTGKRVNKRLIITPAPSFLDYALGSYGSGPDDGKLYLNGSSNILGSIIANDLSVSSKAKLRDKLTVTSSAVKREEDSLFPAIKGNGFVQNQLTLKHSGFPNIPGSTSTTDLKSLPDLSEYFYLGAAPSFERLNEEFIEVQFNTTFLNKFNELTSAYVSQGIADISNIPKATDNLINVINLENTYLQNNNILMIEKWLADKPNTRLTHNNNLYIRSLIKNPHITNGVTFSEDIIVTGDLEISAVDRPITSDGNTIIVGGDLNITALSGNEIELNSNIVVLGDLEINTITTPIHHRGTIVVYGEVRINGSDSIGLSEMEFDQNSIYFDSTIYSFRKSHISNVNVRGRDGNQLVLLANEDIIITRINDLFEFKEKQYENSTNIADIIQSTNTDKPNQLDGYFYTEKNAELYGVGSVFYINGGVFAKKSLEVNAVRGDVEESGQIISPLSPVNQQGRKTRFQVIHDPSVLIKQLTRLPLSDKYRVIVDETIIN
ncbi:hypothetical protein JOC95_002322 [Bacillus tianshenii]|uniref:Uncharacterized protein n=1 Tax=Sutcliffiella tianshenii TaxID=1463404 RepID=A0ABS2P0S1_9BACI|nr:hypothetical protein [Bacillus tianshenii]MBM7620469.1 hypothetical protein [Bacillus tianshenii]